MMRQRGARGRGLGLALLTAVVWVHAAAAAGPAAARKPGVRFSVLDTIPRPDYLRRHAFSLDNFLENEPGGLLVRPGPIGYDARYSRWGIGSGRARVFVNGVPVNDPQNDVAPFAHIATSGLGRMVTGNAASFAVAPWLEGDLVLDDQPAPVSRPNTFVELSKGTNDVRQRRVRFSSEQGIAGLDLTYDEVLNDGYGFDASGVTPDVTDFGKAQSRNAAIVLRGEPGDDSRYAFGMRRFQSTTTGDLGDPARPGSHDGHFVWLDAGVSGASVIAYGRGYVSTHPDSESVNETVGGIVSWDALPVRRASVNAAARVEHTRATIDVGEVARVSLTQATLTTTARWSVDRSTSLTANASVAGDKDVSLAWGGAAGLRRESGAGAFALSAARSFRMPNLGERFLPAHTRDGRTLAGDVNLDPESAWEAGADWEVGGRRFTNRVRATWIRSAEAIAFRPRTVGTETWRVAGNAGATRSMSFFEERARGDFGIGRLRARVDASLLYSSGDREEAFASVPEFMATANALVGGEMFEKTSALYAGAEFVHVDDRIDYNGAALPGFNALNFILEGRLLDARLYVKYLNILDEAYRTQGDYLMTPSSIVYGIEWTLFD